MVRCVFVVVVMRVDQGCLFLFRVVVVWCRWCCVLFVVLGRRCCVSLLFGIVVFRCCMLFVVCCLMYVVVCCLMFAAVFYVTLALLIVHRPSFGQGP